MNVKFEELPEDSRIWVYQSNRRFSEEEISEISIELESFLESWNSHAKPIRSAFQIKYNRFIFIAVDKDFETSGCSIDSSVSFIQSLEKKYRVNLLDKMNVAYKTDNEIGFVSYMLDSMIETNVNLISRPLEECHHAAKRFLDPVYLFLRLQGNLLQQP